MSLAYNPRPTFTGTTATHLLATRIAAALLPATPTGMCSDGRGGWELTPVADGPGNDWIVTVRADGTVVVSGAPAKIREEVVRAQYGAAAV